MSLNKFGTHASGKTLLSKTRQRNAGFARTDILSMIFEMIWLREKIELGGGTKMSNTIVQCDDGEVVRVIHVQNEML
jgi:hypothetical protein